jgi:ketosteroid isomerase-like protein
MTDRKIEIVQDVYAAFGRGDQIYRYRGTEDTARTAEVLRAD